MAFVVDRFQPADLAAGLRLSTQAGWNQVAGDWQRTLELCPEGCLAGRLDGRVVATGNVAAIGPMVRWIGLILVDEAVRGRGYGSVMMDRCLEIARRKGDEIVGLDASDLGRPVYLKKGFLDVAPIDRWTGVLSSTSFRDVGRAGLSSLEEICALDQQACGIDRSPLLAHMLRDPESLCFGYTGIKGLEGFAFALPGRMAAHLGPIVARDGSVLSELLGRVALSIGDTPVVVDCIRTPENNWSLERAGLRISRRLTRMTLERPHSVLMGPMVRAAVSFTWG